VALETKHAGPPASTWYTIPVTSGHEIKTAAPVIGLEPTFPIIADEGTSVTPVSVKIANGAAVPRFTGGGPLIE